MPEAASKRRRYLKEGIIQAAEASDLNDSWIGKNCGHPTVMVEYYQEAKTGDYVCTTCGKAFSQIRVNCPGCDLPVSCESTHCPQCDERIACP